MHYGKVGAAVVPADSVIPNLLIIPHGNHVAVRDSGFLIKFPKSSRESGFAGLHVPARMLEALPLSVKAVHPLIPIPGEDDNESDVIKFSGHKITLFPHVISPFLQVCCVAFATGFGQLIQNVPSGA